MLHSARARRNPLEFVVYHADHGIKPEQMDWIKSQIAAANPKTFFMQEIQIPAELGTVRNALYGPASGDAPVPESKVSYRPRGDRPWSDRVVSWPTRPVNYVQAIGVPDRDDPNKIVLFTVYGGPLAPQHPDDPGNRDVEASKRFWSQHALSLEQWEPKKNPKGDGLDDLRREYAKFREEAIKLSIRHRFATTNDPEKLRAGFDEMVERVREGNGLSKTPEGYLTAALFAYNMIKAATPIR